MKTTKNFLKARDNHEIYYEIYEPAEPKAHVHILHGMAEHISRYEEFAEHLVKNGFAVSGHDQRGHGRTSERNGAAGFFAKEDGFDLIVEDSRQVMKAVQEQLGDLPLILFGHSMGSFVARRYIQLYSPEISKVVLSGTGGDPGLSGQAGLAFAVLSAKKGGKESSNPMLGKLTFGSFAKQFAEEESEYAWLSRDTSEVAKYENDDLCGFAMTNQFYVDLFTGIARINKKKEIDEIRKDLPVFLISGSEDAVGDNGKGVFQTAQQYQQAGLKNIRVYLVENARHEVLHELDKEVNYSIIAEWMMEND
ncbi:MAG TPA: lysophospholipase [Planococcus sp. (in: firmicutes)]|nr:lysophospholipase [Planococcus sp. (in: firmicutes)]